METPKERKKHKKVRAPWRYKEDGTYDTKPINAKEYFTNYYRTKGQELIECPCCGKSVKRSCMYNHNKTKACVNQFNRFINALEVSSLDEDSPIHFSDAHSD